MLAEMNILSLSKAHVVVQIYDCMFENYCSFVCTEEWLSAYCYSKLYQVPNSQYCTIVLIIPRYYSVVWALARVSDTLCFRALEADSPVNL